MENELQDMGARDYGFYFDEEPIFSHVKRNAPNPPPLLDNDVYVYLMGPYTAFNAEYVYDDADELNSVFIDDPLFDPSVHTGGAKTGDYEEALSEFAEQLRNELGVHAFIARDIDIPTAEEDPEGMAVLEQSVAFSAVSDAVVFLLTMAGLTDGVSAEIGTVLADFNLRQSNPEPIRKPADRFQIYRMPSIKSASITEIPNMFDVGIASFESREELQHEIQQFLADLERPDPDTILPIYTPY